ncbi:MAG: UvrD-helicase domain-containing protein [Minisyncoccia bacterium]|jgi:DNA helicase-2/ATP-dependent DNA helicase PcrA
MTTLNEAQKRAVQTTAGPVLIVAGAGSGKTRVIAHRILNLIKKGVPPSSILAITFTNKAAKEMRGRVQALIESDKTLNLPVSIAEQPFVGTFHALGARIIRENARTIGLDRHFTIYDRADSRRAVRNAMLQAGIDPKRYEPGALLDIISRAKGDGRGAAGFKETAEGFVEETAADIWERYDAVLAAEKALDFDDLLLKARDLLDRPEVKARYNSTWRYIHVDEYQDTNRVQYEIVRRLAGPGRDVCVVGDPDQNIYSWRGATIENVMRFEEDYPDAALIALEKNYRSTKTILAAANGVIEKNLRRKKKTLHTDNPVGEKIALLRSYTENDEARAIADSASDLIGSGVPPKEIAVLYRTNFQSRVIEEAFIRKGLPYQLVGVRFFERKEVKDVLSYIRAALNRESRGDIARILNVPPRGIGRATAAKVVSGAEGSLSEATRKRVADFWHLLDDIRAEIVEKKPSETVRFVIRETGIEKALLEDEHDEEKLLNIQELVSVASQYDSLRPGDGIEALLENSALATDQDELEESVDAVRLMTVHASKGLEFDHVFIAGLEQDLFPFKHIDGKETGQDETEEERRLFYVALTRARKKAHLSYAMIRKTYGAERINTPSEFIDDIEKVLIEEHAPERPTGMRAVFIDF